MAIGKENYQKHLNRRKDKKLKKLLDHHDFLNRKTKEIDAERKEGERSGDGKAHLIRLKKQKLAMKDEITRVTEELGKLTKVK